MIDRIAKRLSPEEEGGEETIDDDDGKCCDLDDEYGDSDDDEIDYDDEDDAIQKMKKWLEKKPRGLATETFMILVLKTGCLKKLSRTDFLRLLTIKISKIRILLYPTRLTSKLRKANTGFSCQYIFYGSHICIHLLIFPDPVSVQSLDMILIFRCGSIRESIEMKLGMGGLPEWIDDPFFEETVSDISESDGLDEELEDITENVESLGT
ncbi:hypothetical protein OIU85_024506 [Salix viminalis]|uniref:Uncharacterized protein n=1 Tax=Salix viminalis TaxID=40686 RepID=A0A9Q0Z4V5_SALVM|nr:hypothetical protein OIU85_024506 [Salix viminalis]